MAEKLKEKIGDVRSKSHGRGGAGNINSAPTTSGLNPEDLETPTIKQQNYTTGRGGTGNIVSNDNPENARLAQDIATPVAPSKEATGTYHWGRGGEGNMTTLGPKSKSKERTSKERTSNKGEGERQAQRRPSFQGVMERGKSMLGLGKKDGQASSTSSSSAVQEE